MMKLSEKIKQYLTLERIRQIKLFIKKIYTAVYQSIRSLYHKMDKRQKITYLCLIGMLLLGFLMVIFIHHSPHHDREAIKTDYSISFETKPVSSTDKQSTEMKSLSDKHEQLAAQLSQLTDVSSVQYKNVKNQLETLQIGMASLASQQDVKQLQQIVQTPNTQLMGAVDNLQQSVKQIVKQVAKKVWVEPKTVERYFQLVAVQGFSDGMRVIIDVDGNQTVLSQKQVCPVCRGWTVKSMDFTNQSAVFTKKEENQILYVKLQAN